MLGASLSGNMLTDKVISFAWADKGIVIANDRVVQEGDEVITNGQDL